jgi:hypothetical protein
VAIPVAYPGDRFAVAHKPVVAKKHAGPTVAASIHQKAAPKKSPVAHVAAPKSAAKTPARHTASAHTPNS